MRTDRQSSSLPTDIPVADRDYEGDGNVVVGSDIARYRSIDRKIGYLLTGVGSEFTVSDVVDPRSQIARS